MSSFETMLYDTDEEMCETNDDGVLVDPSSNAPIPLNSVRDVILGNVIQIVSEVKTPIINWEKLKAEKSEDELEEIALHVIQNRSSTIEDIKTALHEIALISENYQEPRVNICNIVLKLMEQHREDLNIQSSSLDVLFNLQERLVFRTHFDQLFRMLERTMAAMGNFPYDVILFQKSLNIISSRLCRPFEWKPDQCLNCIKLILNGLRICRHCKVTRIDAWKKTEKLTQILEEDQLPRLFDQDKYKELFFSVIKRQLEAKEVDEDLTIVLHILLQMSYCQSICHLLLNGEYFNIIFKLLEKFKQTEEVVKLVLSILDYLARIEKSALYFATIPYVELLNNGAFTKSAEPAIRYLSSSILAQTIFHNQNSWALGKCLLDRSILSIKRSSVKWDSEDKNLIRYVSLVPLINILKTPFREELETYAAWTLNYLCYSNERYYMKLIQDEKGLPVILEKIKGDETKESTNLLKRVYAMFCTQNNITEDMLIGDNILTSLKDANGGSESNLVIILNTLGDFVEEEMTYSGSKDDALDSILNIAHSNRNSKSIQKAVLNCLLRLIKKFELTANKNSIIKSVNYTFCCTQLTFEEENQAAKTIESLKFGLEYFQIDQPIYFSTFNNQKSISLVEFETTPVEMVSHLMTLIHAYDTKTEILENCLQCVAILIDRMSKIELIDLLNGEEVRCLIYGLISNLSCQSVRVVELSLSVLSRLFHLRAMRNYWKKESKEIPLLNLIKKYINNETIVANAVRILIICHPINLPPDQELEKLLQSDSIDYKIKYCILSLFVILILPGMKQNNINHNYETIQSYSVSLIFKWWLKPIEPQLLCPVSFLCNNLLNSEAVDRQMYGCWLLTRLAHQCPAALKKSLLQLGDMEELKAIERSDDSKNTNMRIKAIVTKLNNIDIVEEIPSLDELTTMLKDQLIDPADSQKCLHALRRFHGEFITLDQVIIVFEKLKQMFNQCFNSDFDYAYVDFCHGIHREGVALLHTFLLHNKCVDGTLLEMIVESIFSTLETFGKSKMIIAYSIMCFDKIQSRLVSADTHFLMLKHLYEMLDHINVKLIPDVNLKRLSRNLTGPSLSPNRRLHVSILEKNLCDSHVVYCNSSCLKWFYSNDVIIENRDLKKKINFFCYLINQFSNDPEISDLLIFNICCILLKQRNGYDYELLNSIELENAKERFFNFSKVMLQNEKTGQLCALSLVMGMSWKLDQIIDENLRDLIIAVMNKCNITTEGCFILNLLYGQNEFASKMNSVENVGFVAFLAIHYISFGEIDTKYGWIDELLNTLLVHEKLKPLHEKLQVVINEKLS